MDFSRAGILLALNWKLVHLSHHNRNISTPRYASNCDGFSFSLYLPSLYFSHSQRHLLVDAFQTNIHKQYETSSHFFYLYISFVVYLAFVHSKSTFDKWIVIFILIAYKYHNFPRLYLSHHFFCRCCCCARNYFQSDKV